MPMDGTKKTLITIGGSGKLGSYCLSKWLEDENSLKIFNFDPIKLETDNIYWIKEDIRTNNGFNKLNSTIKNNENISIIVFAGYDFPRKKNGENYFSPYEPEIEIVNIAWEINCLIPYLVIKAIDLNPNKKIDLTLIGSLYGDKLPKKNLYSDNEKIFKPVVYGMCKRALEYLNMQASQTMSKSNGRCNLIRFGGIEDGVDEEFKKRYSTFSPTGKMVSLESAFKSLTMIGLDPIEDINGAIIDVDSGIRHV